MSSETTYRCDLCLMPSPERVPLRIEVSANIDNTPIVLESFGQRTSVERTFSSSRVQGREVCFRCADRILPSLEIRRVDRARLEIEARAGELSESLARANDEIRRMKHRNRRR